MEKQPIPENENERLKALKGYNILDSLDEEVFDRLTQLASVICGVPIALVSLIDSDRQWFKSKTGIDVNETARDISFCQHAIMDCEIFEVENALEDDRFKDNPLVQGFPNIRFYAGYPLEDPDGYNLGTLCVIDEKPHKLDDNQRLALQVLGKEVVAQIVARKNHADLLEYKKLFDLSIDMICVAGLDGYFKKVNNAFSEILGWSNTEILSKPFFDFIHPDDIQGTQQEMEKLGQGIRTINFTNRFVKKDGGYVYLDWVSHPELETGNLFAIARDISIEVAVKERKNIQAEIVSKVSSFTVHDFNSIQDINKKLVQCLIDGLNVDRVGIWSFKEEGLVCDLLIDSKDKETIHKGQIIDKNNFPNYYQTLLKGLPIVASNALTNPDTLEFKESYLIPHGINSMLDIPFWRDGNLDGVICCESSMENRKWLDSDLSFAKTMTDAVSMKLFEFEQKEKDKEALIINTRLKNLLSNFQEAVLVEDETRHIVVTNQTFCDFFGIPAPPDVLIGMDCSNSAEQSKSLFKDPEGFVKGIDQILKDQIVKKDEVLELVDGRIFERDYVPIFLDGKYNGHFWKYRDVTEKHKITKELEIAKNELKATFDSLTEGVVVQIPSGEIISCNPAASRILKLSEDQMMGKTSMDPDWNAIKEDGSPFSGEEHPAMAALKSGKSIYNTIMGVRIKEDEPSWININAQLLPNGAGVVCTFSDVTERKQMEENRLKLIELQSSNRLAEETLKAREEFLANMSHEIRTPMNAIIGLSNLMEKAGELNEKQKSYLDVIQLNSDNLLGIINDILDYSKLESGKFEMETTDFNISDSIKNIVSSMQVLADNHEIQLYTNIDAKLPSFVKGDSLRYSQILTNLLSNAIKFSNRNDVNVEVSLIEDLGAKIKFVTKVIDHGIGIAHDKIKDILKPFTQETTSTTRKYGGTGLGLSIVSKLLEFMGSELKIESELGKGSIFSFELILEKGQQILVSKQEKITLKGKYRLLLVEDNQFNQLVATDTLIDWNSNFDISIANNGQEALDILQKNTFDLILMDIQMPVMDGYTATRLIRSSNQAFSNTPIVAMTAHASSLEVEKCLSMGMNAYIPKPFNQQDLYEKIARIIYDSNKEEVTTIEENEQLDANTSQNIDFKVINIQAILDFTKGKPDRILKMVNMFLQETPAELKRLQELFDAKDAPALRTLAHSFKPKFTYMGMPALSEIAKQIEHAAGEGRLNEEVLNNIKFIHDQSIIAMNELNVFVSSYINL
jgi:PAS domain S-box-containing protein